MGTLLPWNFFISLNSFWDYKFRNVSADNNNTAGGEESQTDLQKEFASMLAYVNSVVFEKTLSFVFIDFLAKFENVFTKDSLINDVTHLSKHKVWVYLSLSEGGNQSKCFMLYVRRPFLTLN